MLVYWCVQSSYTVIPCTLESGTEHSLNKCSVYAGCIQDIKKKSAKGVSNVSKSVLFHPGEGGSVSHTTQDEKSWYRLSCIPACVSFNPFVVKMDLSYLK